MAIEGIELEENDLNIARVLGALNGSAEDDGPKWEASFSEDVIILLDAAPHPELLSDGLARDIIDRIQRMRKAAGLVPTDEVRSTQLCLTPRVLTLVTLSPLDSLALRVHYADYLSLFP